MSDSEKVTKEAYFATAFEHARQITDDALQDLEKLTGTKLDSVGKSVVFGAIVKACAFEGLITLRKLHAEAFDVSELLPLTVEDLHKWILENKLGAVMERR